MTSTKIATPEAAEPRFRRLLMPVEHFLATESAGGLVLMAAALLAFLWANSPWSGAYEAMKAAPTAIRLGGFALEKPLELWVNDLLMAVFFFLVGLEIKRELLVGELVGIRKAALPVAGALGGVLVPALIYLAFTAGTPLAAGWGVPMATDIAFAVGVLALLGDRVPLPLKVFLLALAIVDDLVAVLVIALFYTADVAPDYLVLALVTWVVALLYGRSGGGRAVIYLLLGAIVWYGMLKSGVHATIAGVLMAFTVPLRHGLTAAELKEELSTRLSEGSFEQVQVEMGRLEDVMERGQSPLHRFEHGLQPWVAFGIMPVFALFNAGVALTGSGEAALVSMATTGVALGLLIGKPLGICGMVWLACRAGLASLPAGVGWGAVAGTGLLAGIGFTMALFIAGLAFGTTPALDQAKIGILGASVLAAVLGVLVLRATLGPAPVSSVPSSRAPSPPRDAGSPAPRTAGAPGAAGKRRAPSRRRR